MTLAAIRNPDCTACPLHAEGAQTICMMGAGPVPARVAFVGEAPGYHEDQEGVPFIGAAGQFLDDALAKAGIERGEVFVTNVNRCRPRDNRTPNLTEMKACRPYLQAEMEVVQPEIVVLLGNSALKGVLGMSGITSKRGAAIEKDGRTYFPMLHPAAVLRNPGYAEGFHSDMLSLKRLIDGTNEPPRTTVNIIRTAGDFRQFLHELGKADVVAFDVESSTPDHRDKGALEIWAPDWRLDCAAFTWEVGTSWAMPLEHPQSPFRVSRSGYDQITTALSTKRLVGHNLKFDLQAFRRRSAVPLRGHFDTMIASHLLDENGPHGLKPLARMYLGADLYEQEINWKTDNPLDVLATYNGHDTDYTLRLYHLFRPQLLEQQKLARIFKHISMPAMNALVDVELRGFPVNVRRLRDRHQRLLEAMEYLSNALTAYVPEHLRKNINWNPSNFLRHFLFHVLGLPVVSVTGKSGVEAVNEDVLVALKAHHPAVPMLMAHRKYYKWESVYTRKWIAQLKQVGHPRLYPSYNMIGTVTGRLSSNFQQVPRNPFIRGIIGAPPGWKLIEADFSQIELRVAAMVSMDPAMIEVYQQAQDLHMVMAQAITNKPADQVTKEERSRAKPVSFGFLYGMGWRKFVPYARAEYGIEISDTEAQRYRRAFFERFPRLAFWHERQRRLVETLRYVESPIGRRRRLPDIASTDKEVAGEAGRQAINSPVQSFASDLCLLAMGLLEGHEALDPTRCRMLGQLHDSIIFEATDDYAEEAAKVIKAVMENLPVRPLFGYRMPVPIVADVSVVQHWGGQ